MPIQVPSERTHPSERPASPRPLPLVTVGIPTYNRVDSLRRTVGSVLSQTGPFELDVVVSDNDSTDGTRTYLEEMAARDSRLRVVLQPGNQGQVVNFRTVLDEAVGDFFMWLGDDDWLGEGYLAACVEAMEGDAGLSLVGGETHFHGPDGVEPGAPCDLRDAAPAARVGRHFRTVRHNSILFGLMRKAHAAELELPDGVATDWLAVGQLAAVGRVATLTEVRLHRATGGASASMETVTEAFGLQGRRARNPWGVVSRRVGGFIFRGRGLFMALPPLSRAVLSLRVGFLLFRMHYVSHVRRKVVAGVLGSRAFQAIWRRIRPLVRR